MGKILLEMGSVTQRTTVYYWAPDCYTIRLQIIGSERPVASDRYSGLDADLESPEERM